MYSLVIHTAFKQAKALKKLRHHLAHSLPCTDGESETSETAVTEAR